MGKKESELAHSVPTSVSLLVLSPLYPPHTGGLENHAAQFNHHLAALGYTITVFTPHLDRQAAIEETPVKNLRVVRFPAWEIIPNYPVPKLWHPRFWRQLTHVLQQPHAWVISRTRFFLTSPLSWLVATIKGVPWMHIEHGSDFVHLHNPITRGVARLFDEIVGRLVFLGADTLVANSQASANFIKRFAPRRTVTVIYRGVEKAKIAALPALTLPDQPELLVAYVGRLIDGKGVADLLRAFAAVASPHVRLLIVGDGPLRPQLERLAKNLRIHTAVTFRGDTPWAEIIGLLKTADIVVNPSYTEGLPTAVIEAALCECAIIATNVGGTPEIITDRKSGLLVTPGNVPQLTVALRHLLANPTLRTSLGRQAKADVTQRFSWEMASASYQKLLL